MADECTTMSGQQSMVTAYLPPVMVFSGGDLLRLLAASLSAPTAVVVVRGARCACEGA